MKLNNGSHKNIFFRSISGSRFKAVSTAILDEKDRSLKWEDVGIYFFVKTRGEGWQLHLRDLVSRKSNGESSILSSLRRLRKSGWCRLVQLRRAGCIAGFRYDFFDEPLATPQQLVVIENYNDSGKLLSSTESRFGTRRWDADGARGAGGDVPHTQKPVCGKDAPHTTFPLSGKPVCGNAVASQNKNNGLKPANCDAHLISSSIYISSKDLLVEKERDAFDLNNASTSLVTPAVQHELDVVGMADLWWTKLGAPIFEAARGFSARALGRSELIALGDQLRTVGAEDLARRYQRYHSSNEKKIVESGFNIWNFINNLDRLGAEVSKIKTAITAAQKANVSGNPEIDEMLRRFNPALAV